MLKLRKPSSGCQFCNDDDFARRHMLEDEILFEIAEKCTEMLAQATPGYSQHLGEIHRLLVRFRELDDEMARTKRVIADLQAIEAEMSS